MRQMVLSLENDTVNACTLMGEEVGTGFLEEGRDVSTETHRKSELCAAEAGGERALGRRNQEGTFAMQAGGKGARV